MQIFGPESSGKTTLALHAIAEVQKLGGVACFIDAEHAFDAAYAVVRVTCRAPDRPHASQSAAAMHPPQALLFEIVQCWSAALSMLSMHPQPSEACNSGALVPACPLNRTPVLSCCSPAAFIAALLALKR